jgi:hypothetical protein
MGAGSLMRRLALVVLIALGLLGAPTAAFAQVTPLDELLEDPAAHAGEIIVRGELVGDFGFRDDGWVWAQLNDDPYVDAPVLEGGALSGANTGIGVRLPHDMIEGIDRPGGYRYRGPVVTITGVWHHHDPDRGGESYLEATSLTLLEHGRDLEEGPHWVNSIAGGVLLLAAGVLWLTRTKET